MNLEQSFIRKITGDLLHYRFKGGDVHQFCCPYCQAHGTDKAGKKISPSKAKGYFYKKEDSINFKCHKCGTGKQFHKFLKDHFQKEFIAYVKEREQRGTTGKGNNCPTLANALESIDGAMSKKPVFRKQETNQEHSTAKEEKGSPPQQGHGCGNTPKIQILPRMKSPEQQAGCQSHINRLIKQKHERARLDCGELW